MLCPVLLSARFVGLVFCLFQPEVPGGERRLRPATCVWLAGGTRHALWVSQAVTHGERFLRGGSDLLSCVSRTFSGGLSGGAGVAWCGLD